MTENATFNPQQPHEVQKDRDTMKIAIDCPFNTDMLDHDLRHLGDLLKHLQDHGSRGRAWIADDGMAHLTVTEDEDRASALLSALWFFRQIFDEVEARSPRPGKLYSDRC